MEGDEVRQRSTRQGAEEGGDSGMTVLGVGVGGGGGGGERTGMQVIGRGGICTADDVRQYLDAGAVLVAVGTAALADPRCPERIARTWSADG